MMFNKAKLIIIICLFLFTAACSSGKSEEPEQMSPFVVGTLQHNATAAATELPTGSAALLPGSTETFTETETFSIVQSDSTPGTPTATKTAQPNSATATRTSQQFQATTPNPYPVASTTPTLTRTPTPPTPGAATQTATTTVQTGWAGEWVGYYEKADGSFSTGKLVVTLNGSDLTASLEIDNTVISYQGFVFNEGKFATGNMVGGGSQDSFWWDLLPGGQFRGTYKNKFAFCGSRQGISQPAPCLELPTS